MVASREVVVQITLLLEITVDAASQSEAEDIATRAAKRDSIHLVTEQGARIKYLPVVVEYAGEPEEQWCFVGGADGQTVQVLRGAV